MTPNHASGDGAASEPEARGASTSPLRCPECGALEDEGARASSRRGGRVLLAACTTVLLALLLAGVFSHRSRIHNRMGLGMPLGGKVMPEIAWRDLGEIAAGRRNGEALVDAMIAMGEGWSAWVPSELRLWTEFTPGEQAMDLEFLRGGKGAVQPLRWTDLLRMRSAGEQGAKELARTLLSTHADRAVAPSDTLKVTPDHGIVMNGQVTAWRMWIPVVSLLHATYVRDPWFGPSDFVLDPAPIRVHPGWSLVEIELPTGATALGARRVVVNVPGVALVLGLAAALGVLAWFALGGLRARRLRQRALRGECLRCGYQLAQR